MTVIFVVLPLAILIGIAGLIAFIWAARTGQFDDMETPALRMLFDDDAAKGREPRSTENADSASVNKDSGDDRVSHQASDRS